MARPFKVLIPEQKKQFGVVARNLRLLRDDIQKRYGLNNDFKICLPDGTAIDDEEYFAFLEPQTLLIVRRGNPIPDNLISDGGKEVVGRTQTKASLLKIVKVNGDVSWDWAAQPISSSSSPQTAVVHPQGIRTTSSNEATKPLQHIPYIPPPSQPVESYCTTSSRFSSSYHPMTTVHHITQQQLVDTLSNRGLLELQQQQLQLRQQQKQQQLLQQQQQQQFLLPTNSQTGAVLQQQPAQQRYVLQQQAKVLERNYYRVLHCPSGHAGSGQVPGRPQP